MKCHTNFLAKDVFSKFAFKSMIPNLDIYRAAQALIKRHGQDAPIHAAMRADATLDKGDLDGYAVWKRILWAVEELQTKAPKSGEAVH